MIIYLAPYPRGGDSFPRQVIMSGFDILASAIILNEARRTTAAGRRS